MGCSHSQETLETQLLIYKLNKRDIQFQREQLLREYQIITGKVLKWKKIPGYIDYKKIREKRLEKERRENKAKEEEERRKGEMQQVEGASLRKSEEREIIEDVLADY